LAAALAVSCVALVLAAAKAHGRQVRLEREAMGHFDVDFRRDNHPDVEALWLRDRRLFWPAFAVLAGLGVGLATGAAGAVWAPHWPAAMAAVPLAFAGAFAVAGLASLAHFVHTGRGAPAWRRRALQGSAAWWSLVAVLGAACGLLLPAVDG
jgi:hypothetical protein